MRRIVSMVVIVALSASSAGAAEPAEPTVASGHYVPAVLVKRVDARPPKSGLIGFRGTTVRACFTITTEGKVTDVKFPDPDRQEFFDPTIRRALVRWRFEPATLDGVPVEQPGCATFEIRAIGG